MSLKHTGRLSRREMLRALSLAAAGSTALPGFLTGCRQSLDTPASLEAQGRSRKDALDTGPKFLIVIAAAGGASIVDSYLAVRASESANASLLNTFADGQVTSLAGSPFRAVAVDAAQLGNIPIAVHTNQTAIADKHKAYTLVATSTGTSVNHTVAQKRSLTGNAAWRGRTLQECVALQYGAGFPIPNVNMAVGGYLERGTDDTLPEYCYPETVANSLLWPLALDGSKGIKEAPSRALLDAARGKRDGNDGASVFGQTFADSRALARWNAQRGAGQNTLQSADLITKLNILPDTPGRIPLTEYGLSSSPDAAALRAKFPLYATDPVEHQAALAFLLLKYRVSVAVTLGPDFGVVLGGPTGLANPPLAFDFSHNAHRAGQAFMWARIMGVVDRLIDLLKAEPYDATQSMWDRTMIYVATEFGRSRNRAADAAEFGSGHHINNGFVMMSPMVKGNTLLGGVDPNTVLTYGFDARTGAADPGKTSSNEPDIFSGVLTALGVDTSGSGLPDASAFKA